MSTSSGAGPSADYFDRLAALPRLEGQAVLIVPSRRTVIVRLGMTHERTAWDLDTFAAGDRDENFYLWGAMGANTGGAVATAEYLKNIRWHLDLSRRTDGSFAYDGREGYGPGSTADGTYLGASGYYGMNATASYILTYSLPLQRLYITGKRDTPANPPPLALDAPTVAHAVAAANFKVDCPGFTTAQLITSLSDYDPVVRHYAAIEVGKRTLNSTDLTTLRNMVTGTDANGRMGACQALGYLKDTASLSLLKDRLDKTIESDFWVRATAEAHGTTAEHDQF